MRRLIAAGIIAAAGLTSTGALSETVRVDCAYGELTIARIADGDCLSRIAVPTPRPVVAKPDAKVEAKAARPETFRFIESPDPETGHMRTVRVVGPTYLPEDNDEIELRGGLQNPVNMVFNGLASLFGISSAQADEEKPDGQAIVPEDADALKARLEARADIRILAAHN